VHDRVVGAASVAVHWTSVVPTGNSEPDVRVQLTWTGATPPVVLASENVTGTGLPFADVAVWLAGQAMVRAGGGGGVIWGGVVVVGGPGVGDVGDEHPLAINDRTKRAAAGLERRRKEQRRPMQGNQKL
jgi:hypothetical protein